jgi:hypothetical protein
VADHVTTHKSLSSFFFLPRRLQIPATDLFGCSIQQQQQQHTLKYNNRENRKKQKREKKSVEFVLAIPVDSGE